MSAIPDMVDPMEIVRQAYQKAIADAAVEHPALAAAASNIDIYNTVVTKLRDMPEYKAAQESYVQARIEIDFFSNVLSLIKQLIPVLLPLIGG